MKRQAMLIAQITSTGTKPAVMVPNGGRRVLFQIPQGGTRRETTAANGWNHLSSTHKLVVGRIEKVAVTEVTRRKEKASWVKWIELCSLMGVDPNGIVFNAYLPSAAELSTEEKVIKHFLAFLAQGDTGKKDAIGHATGIWDVLE